MTSRFSHFTLVLILIFVFSLNCYADKRVALIIGNSEYCSEGYESLTQPANDADAFNKALKSLGFETILLKNGNLKDMRQSLSKFASILDGADAAVFYYSGHGNSLDHNEYLVPAKTKFDNVAYESQFLSLNSIERLMKQSKFSFIFYDACRNEPDAEISVNGQTKGFTDKYCSNNMMICFASKSGQAAYSGKGTILSPFTEVILANIYKQEDFDKLWHNYIITDSRLSTQQPQKNGGYAGNFYFNQLERGSDSPYIINMEKLLEDVEYQVKQLNFRAAIDLLKLIPNENSNYSEIESKIKQYEFYDQEQQKGRIVSYDLAKVLAQKTNEGYEIQAIVNNNVWLGRSNCGLLRICPNGESLYYNLYYKGKDTGTFNHGGMAVIEVDGKFGCLNLKNGHIIQAEWDNWVLFDDGYAIVCKDNKYGFIDENGSLFVDCTYENLKGFGENGLAPAKKGNKWGYINKSGEVVLDFKWDYTYKFNGNSALVRNKNKYFRINETGSPIANSIVSDTFYFSDIDFIKRPLFLEKRAIVDIYGIQVPTTISDINGSVLGFGYAHLHNGFGYINYDYGSIEHYYLIQDYKIDWSTSYSYINNFKEKYLIICLGNKFALIDSFKNTIIPFGRWDKIHAYDNYLRVYKNNHSELIDIDGKTILPFNQYKMLTFCDINKNLFEASKDDHYGIIDTKAKIIVPFMYDDLDELPNGNFLVELNENYGVIDKNNNIIIPIEFEELEWNEDELMYLGLKNNKPYCFDKQGKSTKIPLHYDTFYEVEENGKIGISDIYGFSTLYVDISQ